MPITGSRPKIPLWEMKRFGVCPICPEQLSGRIDDWTAHLTGKHADRFERMGDIFWVRVDAKPREAYYLGKAYKVGRVVS